MRSREHLHQSHYQIREMKTHLRECPWARKLGKRGNETKRSLEINTQRLQNKVDTLTIMLYLHITLPFSEVCVSQQH